MSDVNYWSKQDKMSLFPDLKWNLPEQKAGSFAIVGGSKTSFSAEIRCAEHASSSYMLKDVNLYLPDALRSTVPKVENIILCESTGAGTFAKFPEFKEDAVLFLGDLTKNEETKKALLKSLFDLGENDNGGKNVLLFRDSVDAISSEPETALSMKNVTIFTNLTQLKKIFSSIYYPKVLSLSMPIMPVVEALHKFALSYEATIVVFADGQIVVAKNGNISSTPLSITGFSPLSLWSGELAVKMLVYQLFNPGQSFESATAALFND